ncbi:FxLD family lantipeptide [Spongiactinospora rosea]|uniref:FxLD family lantipeptide n=1 Tax=Spongiactinospora rosea TaxID=2248750 RepID=A0A366LTS8_9ACTN|nr:FxLD family lanthipeptide [Spongiactinospora rosea]RBQ16943.1 FxLD family lantipeptide [Spongiactinospora rosea]
MIVESATLTPAAPAPVQALASQQSQDWTGEDWAAGLDVSIVESGVAAEQLIRMTDDGCNSTCATACISCGT